MIERTRAENKAAMAEHLIGQYKARAASELAAPPDERKAISGIMALLPENAVCWETGPWPDSIESALNFLVEHLSSNARALPPGGEQEVVK